MGLTTRVLTAANLDEAARLLQAGHVVAFPTETVYGLGANALDASAVRKIFEAKGRPWGNPLIVHLFNQEKLRDVVTSIPPKAQALMDRFWPGPLTLVLPKTPLIPPLVSAGLETVGVRIPDHPLALKLLQKVGIPVAAPSANISGRPSPTRLEHVLTDLGGKIPAVVDGGQTVIGLESTVLDCSREPFRLLRPGSVSLEDLQAVTTVVSERGMGTPPSPGSGYEHYVPGAQVYLVLGAEAPAKIRELSQGFKGQGKKLAVLAADERAFLYGGLTVFKLGPESDFQTMAGNLYHFLRETDRLGIEILFIEGISEEYLGRAIMDRLRQAARNRVIKT